MNSNQETPPLSTTPLNSRPHKLRATCDACAHSKVRCDKEQPACHRCRNGGLLCHYSPSRRMGKPPASGNKYKTRLATGLQDCVGSYHRGSSSSTNSSSSPEPYVVAATTTAAEVESSQTISPAYGNDILGDASPVVPSELQGTFMDGTNEDYFSFLPEAMPSLELVPNHYDNNQAPISYSTSRGSYDDPRTSSWMTSSTYTGDEDFLQPYPSALFAGSSFTAGSFSCPMDMLPDMDQNGHDCTRLAISTLQTLQAHPSSATSAPSFNTYGLPSNDHMVRNNQAAIANLPSLLDCSCPLDQNLAMLITTIISKTLAWYDAIFSAKSTWQSSEFVKHVPATMGGYLLDSGEDYHMRAQLVLTELKTIAKIIERFAEKIRDETRGARTKREAGGGGNEDLSMALVNFLRTQLGSTVRATMERC